jgi:hypothetical protein
VKEANAEHGKPHDGGYARGGAPDASFEDPGSRRVRKREAFRQRAAQQPSTPPASEWGGEGRDPLQRPLTPPASEWGGEGRDPLQRPAPSGGRPPAPSGGSRLPALRPEPGLPAEMGPEYVGRGPSSGGRMFDLFPETTPSLSGPQQAMQGLRGAGGGQAARGLPTRGAPGMHPAVAAAILAAAAAPETVDYLKSHPGPDLSRITNEPVGGNLARWWRGEPPAPSAAPAPSPGEFPSRVPAASYAPAPDAGEFPSRVPAAQGPPSMQREPA